MSLIIKFHWLKFMVIKLIFISLALLFFDFSYSQLSNLLRGEVSADENDYCYFIPVSDNGLMVVSHYSKSSKQNDSWAIQLYSKNLQQVYNKSISTPNNNFLQEYINQDDSLLYLFFSREGGSKIFTVIKWEVKNGNFSVFTHSTPDQSSVSNINVLDNNIIFNTITTPSSLEYFGQALFTLTTIPIFFGTTIYSEVPKIIYFNTTNNNSGTTTLYDEGISQVLYSYPDSSRNSIISIIKNKKNHDVRYIISEFDLIKHESINQDITSVVGNNLLNVKLIDDGKGGVILVGDYNNSKGISRNSNSASIGLFVGRLFAGKLEYLKFYPFSKFTNAASALSPTNIFKTSRKSSNETSNNLSFRLLWHDRIINQDSCFIVIAESFHPEYHTETNFDSRGLVYSNDVFDGFRFTNAIAAAFDLDGNLIWDNFMRIEDIISYELTPNVEVYFGKNEQVMLYYSKEKIYSKVIRGNELIFKDEASEVVTVNKNEKILYENYNKIYHWYDGYFLLTGYQSVYNAKGDKRNVFYFLKISFE